MDQLTYENFDVGLLEKTLQTLNETQNEAERNRAQQSLMKFRQHPQAWRKVDSILEQTQSLHTKFFALQILEDLIRFRWLELPPEQRTGLRGYLIKLITRMSSNQDSLQKQKTFMGKLNLQIVEIAKHDWPANWPTFISELVNSAKTSETICENNMNILKLLSEEIFDYSSGKMTQAKIQQLKASMTKEFQAVFKLCLAVLTNAKRPTLLLTTLQTLLGFLNWIPIGYIFETTLVPILVSKFFQPQPSRVLTLQCLTEIAALSLGSKYTVFFVKLFGNFMHELNKIIRPEINISQAYRSANAENKKFVHYLVLFLTTMFKTHLGALEEVGQRELVLRAHDVLAQATNIYEETIFNICLDYWNSFAENLYHESAYSRGQLGFSSASSSSSSPLLLDTFPEDEDDGMQQPRHDAPTVQATSRCQAYSPILARVRASLISRMPKPEEVLIVEDEYGKIVREQQVDTVALGLYKSMRSALVYLTHLDPEHTQNLIIERLKQVCSAPRWTYESLNTLCWSIGSISGALNEQDEKHFIIATIKDLLRLVGTTKPKDAKAVIASNIMYIVGQYPRFLRAHWRFLKTVVKKLFEFMHEHHPGVQDMACDTFLKIARRCRGKFVQTQEEDTVPFIQVILEELSDTIRDLKPAQIQVFYEAVASMIQSHPEPRMKVQYIHSLMSLPNRTWAHTLNRAKADKEYFHSTDVSNIISTILKTNERVCFAVGAAFGGQMQRMFKDILGVFKNYNTYVSEKVQSEGPSVLQYAEIRGIRAAKKEILKLIETYVEKADDLNPSQFLPLVLDSVLGDYSRNPPDARDAGVLSLFAAIINKLGDSMVAHVPDIFRAVFDSTISMINKNFLDYPDHRVQFFSLLTAIITHCFPAVFKIPEKYFKLIVDSVVWASRHTLRSISEAGLSLILNLWRKMAKSQAASHFYRTFYIKLFREVFYVLTDRSHKFGFAIQASILQLMIISVENDTVSVPLWNTEKITDPNMTNKLYLRQCILNLITSHFKNVGTSHVKKFILGLFSNSNDLAAFKTHLRDFLVRLQEFSPDTNEDLHLLYQEENEAAEKERTRNERRKNLKIPGLIAPATLEDE